MRCWYCGKKMEPGGWDWIVTSDGKQHAVCKDDRTCRPGTGIRGRGEKPPAKKQGRIKALRNNQRK